MRATQCSSDWPLLGRSQTERATLEIMSRVSPLPTSSCCSTISTRWKGCLTASNAGRKLGSSASLEVLAANACAESSHARDEGVQRRPLECLQKILESWQRRVTPVRYLETGVLHCGDKIDILGATPSECVDLIYLDPPFFSNRTYEVIWGEEAELRSFKDRWAGGIDTYLDWIEPR